MKLLFKDPKEMTEKIVTWENAKLLQNHVTILDRPSHIYKAIKSSRYYFVLYIFSIYKMLKTLTNKCIKFYCSTERLV